MQTRTLYGIIALLLAALVLSSSASLYYYYEYNQVSQSNSNLLVELGNASQKYNETALQYNQLASRFNSLSATYNGSTSSFENVASIYNQSVLQFNLLSNSYVSLSNQYNETISLLSSAIGELNTSEPAYVNGSAMLTGLWKQYGSLQAGYKNIVQNYSQIFAEFNSVLLSFSQTTNKSLSNYLQPVKPISVSLLTSDVLFDFGNGTKLWFNNTSIQPGWNLYIATVVLANGNVQASWYPQYAEHLVNGIFGVENSFTKSWFEWSYNMTSSSWVSPLVGADQLMVYNASVFAWTFCGYNSTTFTPSCTPP